MQFDPDDTSDPVIATYDVFISDADAQRIVLQYPDRPADKVYNADSRQKPVELRIKPQTGIVEVEVPVDTNINYDVRKGLKYGNAMRQSRTMAEGGAMGMAGGFNVGGGVVAGDDGAAPATKGRGKGKGKAAATEGMLEDGDVYDSDEDKKAGVRMMTQTLGGRIVPAVDGDPIYMLGAFKDSECLSRDLAPSILIIRRRTAFVSVIGHGSATPPATPFGRNGRNTTKSKNIE